MLNCLIESYDATTAMVLPWFDQFSNLKIPIFVSKSGRHGAGYGQLDHLASFFKAFSEATVE
jgi:hypothetical protein